MEDQSSVLGDGQRYPNKLYSNARSGMKNPNPLSKRIVLFLLFACGCIFAVHLIMALQSGSLEAVSRYASNPLKAMPLYSTVVAACFTATTIWRLIRKSLFRDYIPMPMSRFGAGFVLVVMYVIVAKSMTAAFGILGLPANVNASIATLLLQVVLKLFVAAILAIESEAIIVRACHCGKIDLDEP
ncbi:hypothetical protein N9N28_12675 [Rubripirellula amarantea]|nr:hypothetical protein [Rubripirellula amarantea]